MMIKGILAVLAFGVIFGAAIQMPGEFAALQDRGRDYRSLTRSPDDSGKRVAHPASVSSSNIAMQSCQASMISFAAMTSPGATREVAARRCLAQADSVLSDNPTLAIAHLARAVALYTLGQAEDADEARALSAKLAPSENWIAARRLTSSFFFAAISGQDPDDLDRADIRQLLQSATYRPAIVDIYYGYPDQQGWIGEALEGQDGKHQQAFLSLVGKRRLP